jgi:hypothetical protein
MLRAMRFGPFVIWLLGIGALASSGCAYGEVKQVMRAQFASELDCPEVSVKRRDAWYGREEHQFKVTGCGVVRTYTCEKIDERVSYDEPACTWVEGDIDTPKLMVVKPEQALPEEEPPMEPMPEEAPAEEPKSHKAKPKLEDPTVDETGESLDTPPAEPSDEAAGGDEAKPEPEPAAPKPAAPKPAAPKTTAPKSAAPKAGASGRVGGGIKLGGGTKKK